jgi:pSer/pThr/pTyr-binding forkhead associated (FHA) protein
MWQLSIHLPDGTRAIRSVTDPRMTIGRHSDNSIQIPDETVSGCHAEVFQINGGLTLRDLDSTNGTFVDGVAVEQKELSDSCRVMFGSVECAFDFLQEDEEDKQDEAAKDDVELVEARRELEEARQRLADLTQAHQEELAQLAAEHESRMEEIQVGYEEQLASAVLERGNILHKEEELRARLAKVEEEHKQATMARENEHREWQQVIAKERYELSATAADLQKRMDALVAEGQQARQREEDLAARLKRAEAILELKDRERHELQRKLDDIPQQKASSEKQAATQAKALEDARRDQQKLRQRVEELERETATLKKTQPTQINNKSAKAEDELKVARQKIEALESSGAVLRAEARRIQESAASDRQRLSTANSSLSERIAAADKEIAELREKLARKETAKMNSSAESAAGTLRVAPTAATRQRYSPRLLLVTTALGCLAAGCVFGFVVRAGFFTRPTAIPPRPTEERAELTVSKKKESPKRARPVVGLRPLEERPDAAVVTKE